MDIITRAVDDFPRRLNKCIEASSGRGDYDRESTNVFHEILAQLRKGRRQKKKNESGTKIWRAPGVAGIGYGYNVDLVIYGETTSLTRSVVDESMKMPDIATVAAMHVLRSRGYDGGASTALHFLVSLYRAYQLKHSREVRGRLAIVTIIGDPGE
ncbi:hypothetical protein ANCDUO_23185 [Ancylostoma duodenale]|uniref:Uncharacterized protein n=1 Tax=Ancylostoma duodenale TaxID=51022 RepID=A0A0C2FDY4_9BILA|nr:hypothetical protein ANCDUO_23185 [Ancylostoma duodenale]